MLNIVAAVNKEGQTHILYRIEVMRAPLHLFIYFSGLFGLVVVGSQGCLVFGREFVEVGSCGNKMNAKKF